MTKRIFKTLYVFYFVLFLLLCGCKGNLHPPDIVTDFSAEFNSNYREAEYSGNISTNRQGVTYIGISSPKELDGINFTYKNGKLEMSRENLICSADEAYIPQCSFPSLVKSIFDGASDGRAKFSSRKDNFYIYNLSTDNGECTLTTDNEGKIIIAEIKKAKLKIEFSEIKTVKN